MQYSDYQLVLASKSPRRRQLLSQLGFPVSYVDIEVDEAIDKDTPIPLIAQRIAEKKSQGIDIKKLADNEILITSDTVVVWQNRVLGKPHSKVEAKEYLQLLSGHTHQVFSGVCMKTKRNQSSFVEKTDVTFRPLQHEEIDYYLENFNYKDKAGAYGIQEWIGMVGISKIEGCYYNVMGLPLARLYKELLLLLQNQ